jgi:hypothetical protein
MFPNRTPEDTWFVPRANGLFVHIRQRSSHENGKTFVHLTRSPTWTECVHTVGCGLVSQPDCLHTGITAQFHAAFSTIPSMFTHCYHYPVPCSLQHDTFHVDLGRAEPCYPTCGIVTLIRVYYHTCYCLPYDPGQSRV